MIKTITTFITILLVLFFLSCEKDVGILPDDDVIEEEELYLTIWEYDKFDGQNVKTGAFYDYYVRGNTGAGIFYWNEETDDADLLYEYEIIPQDISHEVFFSANDSSDNEKKFEYVMSDNKLTEIIGFHNGSPVTTFNLEYSSGHLVSITKDDVVIVNDIEYDSKGNIIRIGKINGNPIQCHFKICESKNPFMGMFKNFEIYSESLISIISFINPNFVLDVETSTSSDFDWSCHNKSITAETNEDNLPETIYEVLYDTGGNITSNKIIAVYEYY